MVWSDKPQAAAESRSDVLYMIFNEAFFQPAHRLTFDNTSLCAEPLRVQLYTRASVQRLKLTSGCQLMCNYIMNCNGIHIFFCLPRVAFKCVHNASCLCVCVCVFSLKDWHARSSHTLAASFRVANDSLDSFLKSSHRLCFFFLLCQCTQASKQANLLPPSPPSSLLLCKHKSTSSFKFPNSIE